MLPFMLLATYSAALDNLAVRIASQHSANDEDWLALATGLRAIKHGLSFPDAVPLLTRLLQRAHDVRDAAKEHSAWRILFMIQPSSVINVPAASRAFLRTAVLTGDLHSALNYTIAATTSKLSTRKKVSAAAAAARVAQLTFVLAVEVLSSAVPILATELLYLGSNVQVQPPSWITSFNASCGLDPRFLMSSPTTIKRAAVLEGICCCLIHQRLLKVPQTKGGVINKQTRAGMTALHFMAKLRTSSFRQSGPFCSDALLLMLLEQGASIKMATVHGQAPAHLAGTLGTLKDRDPLLGDFTVGSADPQEQDRQHDLTNYSWLDSAGKRPWDYQLAFGSLAVTTRGSDRSAHGSSTGGLGAGRAIPSSPPPCPPPPYKSNRPPVSRYLRVTNTS
jgi:hypothetical protein